MLKILLILLVLYLKKRGVVNWDIKLDQILNKNWAFFKKIMDFFSKKRFRIVIL